MKRIRLIELLAEIKANLVPFLSIAMFVGLGVGLFLGIQWGGVAIRGVTERTFEAGKMHDVEVQFPYGITEDDAKKLAAIDGVTDVELGYSSYATMLEGSNRFVVKFQGLTERIDLPTVVEGALPTKEGEVALLSFWAQDHGLAVGDRITLKHDGSDSDDDGMESLTSDSFVITGLVEHPAYLSKVAGSLGAAAIGSGSVDVVGFVTDASFDIDFFNEGYPNAYLRCDGLRGMNTFTAEYQDALDSVVQQATDLGATLATARYQDVRTKAQEKINDAQDEISNAEQKLEDAQGEIADGEKEIADGEKELKDGEKDLAEGEREIADAAGQLADGKSQLDEAEGQLADGAAKIAEGERELREGEAELAQKRGEAEAELTKAKKELDAAEEKLETSQAQYESYLKGYQQTKEGYEKHKDFFDGLRPLNDAAHKDYDPFGKHLEEDLPETKSAFDTAASNYKAIKDDPNYTDEQKAASWDEVVSSYDAFCKAYDSACGDLNNTKTSFKAMCDYAEVPMPELPEPPAMPELTPETLDEAQAAVTAGYVALDSAQNAILATKKEIDGQKYQLLSMVESYDRIGEHLPQAKKQLKESKEELDKGWKEYRKSKKKYEAAVAKAEEEFAKAEGQLADGRAELAQGKSTYEQKRAEFENARATYEEKLAEYNQAKEDLEQGRVDLEEGRKKLADAKRELEDAKRELSEKQGELDDAKGELADAQQAFDDMEEYEWIVFPRLENGGAQSIDTISLMMGNVRWAMALLFVLVGLFVCYSAVSRLVNDEIVQVGTKKAVGFREGEITRGYLSFSGLAVVVGGVLAGVLAVFVVQTIMNPASAASFTLPPFAPHFDPFELLVGVGIEMVLILLATWLAAHGLLKRNAIELLNGGGTKEVKERFYERTNFWRRMPLFSQTIVNNIVNDKRRVAATLIGVIGCTALIVTAVTLSRNVANSLVRHYQRVYDFDSVAYLDTDVRDAAGVVGGELTRRGLANVPVHIERLQVRQPNGYRTAVSLYVPEDLSTFDELYHVISVANDGAGLDNGGVWISRAYAEHMGIGVGDELQVTEGTGRTHTFVVGGVFEYYLLRNELVMGPEEYLSAFGEKPETNAVLVNTNETDLDQLRSGLLGVEGYDTLVDDYADSSFAFGEMASLLDTVVAVYLLLSAAMAVVVLLNLYLMFVAEKKRELIVLMICGYSVGDAKAYIYRDSIALTVIGIVLGAVFGTVMGRVTVKALEPSYGFFLRDVSWLAVGAGVVGAGVFSALVLLYALRKIGKFDLTDINRF